MNDFISISRIFGHAVILFLLIFSSCNDKNDNPQISSALKQVLTYPQKTLVLESGEELHTFIAQSDRAQTQGLSGIQNQEFKANYAMFFPGDRDHKRQFWMPDTYFDLDIIFLDKDMKVVEINRNVPHHPGRQEPPPIKRTGEVFCRHVLEVKSSTDFVKKIRFGQTLKWK